MKTNLLLCQSLFFLLIFHKLKSIAHNINFEIIYSNYTIVDNPKYLNILVPKFIICDAKKEGNFLAFLSSRIDVNDYASTSTFHTWIFLTVINLDSLDININKYIDFSSMLIGISQVRFYFTNFLKINQNEFFLFISCFLI